MMVIILGKRGVPVEGRGNKKGLSEGRKPGYRREDRITSGPVIKQ